MVANNLVEIADKNIQLRYQDITKRAPHGISPVEGEIEWTTRILQTLAGQTLTDQTLTDMV
jgi:hypothetical protein